MKTDRLREIRKATVKYLNLEISGGLVSKLEEQGIDASQIDGAFWKVTHFTDTEPDGGWAGPGNQHIFTAREQAPWAAEFISRNLGTDGWEGCSIIELQHNEGQIFGENGYKASSELESFFHDECEMLEYKILGDVMGDFRAWAWELPLGDRCILMAEKKKTQRSYIILETDMITP